MAIIKKKMLYIVKPAKASSKNYDVYTRQDVMIFGPPKNEGDGFGCR